MSLVAAVPGGILAFFGAMGGISGASGLLMIAYFAAAAMGLVLALLPVTIMTGIWPKTGPRKAKAKVAAKAAAPEKGAKAAAVAEAGSEELDLADDEEEFAPASDEFEAVSDDEFEFSEADEFDEEEDK